MQHFCHEQVIELFIKKGIRLDCLNEMRVSRAFAAAIKRASLHDKDRLPFLIARNKMTEAARSFFSSQSYVEVDTAALQISPGNLSAGYRFARRQQARNNRRHNQSH